MFKKMSLIVVLGFLLLAAGFAQNSALDFILHNKTGADIHAIHISPSDKNDWEENILKDAILEDGESVHIQFSPRETAELWDLKVGDIEGTGLIWENLKLTTIHELTLKIVDGKPIAEIK
jgi:hypothetical protein